MNDKPRRGWFQIRLSTAIVMMFVAGCILGLNFQPYESLHVSALRQHSNICYGWPAPVYLHFINYDMPIWSIGNFATIFFIGDVVCWTLILFAVAMPAEWLVRRNIRLHFGTFVIVGMVLLIIFYLNTLSISSPTHYRGPWLQFGWPVPAWREIPADYRSLDEFNVLGRRLKLIGGGNPLWMLFDLLSAVFILVAVAASTEFVIRRGARKP